MEWRRCLNYFCLDDTFKKNAKSLDLLRLPKMTVETAQILSTAIHLRGDRCGSFYDRLYRSTHQNHPVVKWAASHSLNCRHLCSYLQALLEEYTRRFGKVHSVTKMIPAFHNAWGECTSDEKPTFNTLPPMTMPEPFKVNKLQNVRNLGIPEYGVVPDVIESYRRFFASKPRVSYDINEIPRWFLQKRLTSFKVRTAPKVYAVWQPVVDDDEVIGATVLWKDGTTMNVVNNWKDK